MIEDLTRGEKVDLAKSKGEKDLGVLVQSDLDWSKNIHETVSKAKRILGMLSKAFTSTVGKPTLENIIHMISETTS